MSEDDLPDVFKFDMDKFQQDPPESGLCCGIPIEQIVGDEWPDKGATVISWVCRECGKMWITRCILGDSQ